MVFSSIPAYLDPANWQQNQNYNQSGNSDLLQLQQQQQQQQHVAQQAPLQPHGVGGAGTIRPGSMADRARMANIPMPETALKCPRCESTHTKFCYFNNYSLSQPRHFCKACRRYWTRGGALRSVPVGGGCRRNKRSSKGSSSSSKSEPANSETANSGSTNSTVLLLPSNTATPSVNILGGLPQLGFMPPLTHLNPGHELGLNNYSGISGPNVGVTSEMNFQTGSNLFSGNGDGGVSSLLSSNGGGLELWRMHHTPQFPNFLGGFDPTVSQGGVFYQNNYQAGGVDQASGSGYVGAKLSSSSSMMSQLASVKMEASHNYIINTANNQDHHELQSSLARRFTGSVQGNEHQWSTSTTAGATAWTDLSGFSSSSTSNPL